MLINIPKNIFDNEIINKIGIRDIVNVLKINKRLYDEYKNYPKFKTNKTCIIKKLEYNSKYAFLTQDVSYLIDYLNRLDEINLTFIKFFGKENYQQLQNARIDASNDIKYSDLRHFECMKDKIITISYSDVSNYVNKHNIIKFWNDLGEYLTIPDSIIPIGIIKHVGIKKRSFNLYPYNDQHFDVDKQYGKALLAFSIENGNFYYIGGNIVYIIYNVNDSDKVYNFKNIWEWFNC